jgi:hypothetical protein
VAREGWDSAGVLGEEATAAVVMLMVRELEFHDERRTRRGWKESASWARTSKPNSCRLTVNGELDARALTGSGQACHMFELTLISRVKTRPRTKGQGTRIQDGVGGCSSRSKQAGNSLGELIGRLLFRLSTIRGSD